VHGLEIFTHDLALFFREATQARFYTKDFFASIGLLCAFFTGGKILSWTVRKLQMFNSNRCAFSDAPQSSFRNKDHQNSLQLPVLALSRIASRDFHAWKNFFRWKLR